MSSTRILVTVFCVAGALAAAPVCAAERAKSYPDRPVRLVVPQAPGGGIDFMARLIALRLTDSLGQPVIVDNRTGAGSTIGTAIVVKSAADGHTLAVGSISMAFNPTLYKDLPYDTLKDLAPVGRIAISPNVLSVNLSGPKSVQELIQLAKSRPGKLNYGSGGIGGSDHVCMEYLLSVAGIKAGEHFIQGLGAGAGRSRRGGSGHVFRAYRIYHAAREGLEAARAGGLDGEAHADPAGGADDGRVRLAAVRLFHLVRAVGTGRHAEARARTHQR
jgi:hypothetical protein